MIERLEEQLNDFSMDKRASALRDLITRARSDRSLLPPEGGSVNMHCHSFFSFNSFGFSPTALVWLARKLGLRAAGIVDFDTLDGVEEFLSACDMADLRGSAALETRIYIAELGEYETNSPGEPGVSYATGIGFASGQVNESGRAILNGMRARADQRNRGMIERLNAYLHPLAIDYDRDVLPLTPSGNATERHILVAYLNQAQKQANNPASFWSRKLELGVNSVSALMQERAAFSDVVRRKLMKKGGVGYVQPGADSFPIAQEFYHMAASNGALPTYNYLDGNSNGEHRMEEVLELLVKKGIAAFNLIPNLAIPDAAAAQPGNAKKLERQKELLLRNVKIARGFDLPLHIGTEMNSQGQRQMDNLDTPELLPLKPAFIDGAFFIYGHVRMQRELGMGFYSDWAFSFLPTRAERNAFFTAAGCRIPPGGRASKLLKRVRMEMSPPEILRVLESSC